MGSACCPQALDKSSEEQYVSPEEFVDSLVRHSRGGKDGKEVKVNLELIETILLKDSDDAGDESGPIERKRASSRKPTGYISKDQMEEAVSSVRFADPPGQASASSESAARVKERKGTGFVTKEKLLHMLDELSDGEQEEDSAMILQKSEESAVSAEPKSERDRIKARKGTGFVSKSKLKKVLAAVGDDEE